MAPRNSVLFDCDCPKASAFEPQGGPIDRGKPPDCLGLAAGCRAASRLSHHPTVFGDNSRSRSRARVVSMPMSISDVTGPQATTSFRAHQHAPRCVRHVARARGADQGLTKVRGGAGTCVELSRHAARSIGCSHALRGEGGGQSARCWTRAASKGPTTWQPGRRRWPHDAAPEAGSQPQTYHGSRLVARDQVSGPVEGEPSGCPGASRPARVPSYPQPACLTPLCTSLSCTVWGAVQLHKQRGARARQQQRGRGCAMQSGGRRERWVSGWVGGLGLPAAVAGSALVRVGPVGQSTGQIGRIGRGV